MALPSGLGCTHLLWIIAAAGVGFTTSFVLTDLVHLPIPAYHACYFASVVAFLGLYTSRTRLSLSATVRPRLMLAVILGVVAGAVLAQRVLAEPSSAGRINAPDVIWRGIVYGTLDGAMLSAFPWIVTWRALGGEHATLVKHAALGAVALGGALIITSAYHAGYRDFRGSKLVQANIGNAIATIPTLVAANPVASPIAHAILHVSAVVHNPRSDLFLPPHEQMLTLRAGLLYFAFVFGAGFVLGTARVLWIVPRFGVRAAEMLEMPLMLSISFISARWIVRRLAIPSQWTARLAMGGVALAVLVAAELTTVLRLRGLSVRDYVHTLDPVTGTVYYVSLGVFGVVPLLVKRKERNA